MFNPLTYLNELFDTFAARTLSGHDQLICLHIFNKFNRARWPETVRIADRELQELCRLYDSNGKPATIDTIRKAKSRLKLKGIIEFTSGNGSSFTEYKLPCLPPNDTPADTPNDTPADTLGRSNQHVREDVLDVKTDTEYNAEQTRARETKELDDLIEYWETAGGSRLNMLLISKLDALLTEHTLSDVKAAIDRAVDGANNPNYGFSLDYVKLKLSELKNGRPKGRKLKGGVKFERGGISSGTSGGYAIPTDTGNEPWANY